MQQGSKESLGYSVHMRLRVLSSGGGVLWCCYSRHPGHTRCTALLCTAPYTPPPRILPPSQQYCQVLPLQNKDQFVGVASEVCDRLLQNWKVDMDVTGSIGAYAPEFVVSPLLCTRIVRYPHCMVLFNVLFSLFW